MLHARDRAASDAGAEHTTRPAAPPDVATWWRNAWRPTTREDAYEITAVEGEIPRALRGTLYRNGPSQKLLPRQGYEALHLFDGDGLVHAFRFEDGRVFYRGRFVESPSYLLEQEAGRAAFGFVGTGVDDPSDALPMRTQYNTNVVYHGGRLLALVENAPPFEIDPRTLGPIGTFDLHGRLLGMSTTAHPKIDGVTGQMVIHGYQPFAPFIQLYVLEPDGSCSLAEPIDAPWAGMLHDFAITEHHVVFPLCPITWDGEALMSGKPFADTLAWEPERGLKFGVRSRAAGGAVRWFDAPTPGYMFHPGNAYEENGTIYMDACTYLDGEGFLAALRSWRSGKVGPGYAARPFLYELDLATGTCRERQLDDRGAEFPRLDDRRIGHRNRFGYAVLSVPGTKAGEPDHQWSRVVKYDRQGGPSVVHDFGRWQWPSEPVFVPRTAEAAEDDGFVLNVLYDGTTDGSYLTVLDARRLDGPPLARAHLAHRIPQGFHGNFVADLL